MSKHLTSQRYVFKIHSSRLRRKKWNLKLTPNQAREKLCLPKIKNEIEKENDRLLELCMFALLPKRIYNHELADKTKEAFKNIIKKNINEDTYTIRNEIVKYRDVRTKK